MNHPVNPPKPFKRRRCQNCNRLYLPSREDQKFCRELPDKDKCRKEFYRYGSSYGPLKTGLHKAIDKKYAELAKSLTFRMVPVVEALARLEVRIVKLEFLNVELSKLRAQFDLLRGRYEGHTHDIVSGWNGEYEEYEILGPKDPKKPVAPV